jgi:hypothetical protein
LPCDEPGGLALFLIVVLAFPPSPSLGELLGPES